MHFLLILCHKLTYSSIAKPKNAVFVWLLCLYTMWKPLHHSFVLTSSEPGAWSLAWRRMSSGGPSTSTTLPSILTQGRRCLWLAGCLLRCQWTCPSQAACSPSTGTAELFLYTINYIVNTKLKMASSKYVKKKNMYANILNEYDTVSMWFKCNRNASYRTGKNRDFNPCTDGKSS